MKSEGKISELTSPESYIRKEAQYYNQSLYRPLPIVITKAKGALAWDVNGKKYLDFSAGEGSVNQGHCNPKILKSLEKQTSVLPIITDRLIDDQMAPYEKLICETFGFQKVFLQSGDAEACEATLKFARRWGVTVKGIPNEDVTILFTSNCARGNYLVSSASNNDPRKNERFGPFENLGFQNIEFNDSEALENRLRENPNIAAFILEPIQTLNKFVIPEDGYLKKCREICSRYNVLLVFNEMTTGLGRTGKMLACDFEGVKPDVLLLGKSLCGGFLPAAAILGSKEFTDVIEFGMHGSSYTATTLSCVIGEVALNVLVEDGMVKNSAERGDQFLKLLRSLKSPLIKEVSGRGLLIAVQFEESDTFKAQDVVEKLVEGGIMVKQAILSDFILFTPPLIVTKEDIDEAFLIFEKIILSM